MPHDDAPLQVAVCIIDRRAGLYKHLAQGGICHGGVILCAGKLRRQRAVAILIVGKPDVHIPGQCADSLNGFIAAGVVDNRQGKARRSGSIQCLCHPGQIVGRRDQIQIFGAAVLQLHKNIGQPLGGDRLAHLTLTDGVVLAVAAPQGAAAEKYRAAPGGGIGVAAQAGLLPVVQGGAGHPQGIIGPAEAPLPCGAVGPAGPGAKGTVVRQLHGKNLFHKKLFYKFTTNRESVVYYIYQYHKIKECAFMSTPHNRAEKGDFAKTVLMPGDPLRAKFIAETFLEDVRLVTDVRGMLGYTGSYQGRPISVMGSGMGMPSIGIYSYELYSQYGVENIIRIGSAGSYTDKAKLFDVVLATGAYSESNYAVTQSGDTEEIQAPSAALNEALRRSAAAAGVPLIEGNIHSSDVFYRQPSDAKPTYWERLRDEKGCLAVEMESFALFHNAKVLGKRAACLLTISDSFVSPEITTAEQRQTSFTAMMQVALGVDAFLEK